MKRNLIIKTIYYFFCLMLLPLNVGFAAANASEGDAQSSPIQANTLQQGKTSVKPDQYTEGTCLLIASERDRYAEGSRQQQELTASFQRHCVSPRKVQGKSLAELVEKAELEDRAGGVTGANGAEGAEVAERAKRSAQSEVAHRGTAVVAVPGAQSLRVTDTDVSLPPHEQILRFTLKGLMFLVLGALLLALLAAVFSTNSAKRRGEQGEKAIADIIRTHYRGERYGLFTNLLFPVNGGMTTEVDLLLIRPNFVLVIESKHYSGWIFASPHAKTWKQVLHRKHSSFQNPVHQNFGHCEAVKAAFGIDDVSSLVVFGVDATFKTPYPDGVISIGSLTATLQLLEDRYSGKNLDCYQEYISVAREIKQASDDDAHQQHFRALGTRLGSDLST
ncbi:NERD domain-containing protein [Shewanella sp. JM162201]|uniref:NERD domain-containing protein n=1 Tax=Shewanella jiangmenensis TaxID=2837387 RepID=A0ABS5V609_9GAMM|nr:nuclease-related domain-containing protein [Shewanella jiangmenensis]MBT1445882.1 NERD domain-containing protein [Shewanella jiangmenensis]